MSDLIIPPGFGNATIHLKLDGHANEFTLSHGYEWSPSVSSPSAHAETIFGGWNTVGAPFDAAVMSNKYKFVSVTVIENHAGVMFEGEFVANVAGINAVNLPAPNLSILIQKRTGLAGRKHRGRFFSPVVVIDESLIDWNGNIFSTSVEDLQDQFEFVRSALAGADLPMALLHATGEAPDPITALVVEQRCATQRRRLR